MQDDTAQIIWWPQWRFQGETLHLRPMHKMGHPQLFPSPQPKVCTWDPEPKVPPLLTIPTDLPPRKTRWRSFLLPGNRDPLWLCKERESWMKMQMPGLDTTSAYARDSLSWRSLLKCLTPMLDSWGEDQECECSTLWCSGRRKFQKHEKLYWFVIYRNLSGWTNVERLKLTWLKSSSTPHSHPKSELKPLARQCRWRPRLETRVVKALVACLGRDMRKCH